ncbi:glycoside hydrolase family 88 protein [Candidatus Bathyarchaeota archaeon]|nr:glycoside hydrolase family 88 protein [Candidatus Bathyarchaeota archaeon]
MTTSTADPTPSTDVSGDSQRSLVFTAGDVQGSETSWSDHNLQEQHRDKASAPADRNLKAFISEAFSENILAKAIRTATRSLIDSPAFDGPSKTPRGFPETVLQRGPSYGRYEYREPDFWTCGYFPGQLWALRERLVKYPQHVTIYTDPQSSACAATTRRQLLERLTADCAVWTEPLHAMAARKDTHDLGFIIMPALQREWELTSNPRCLDSIIHAARSLASRYVPFGGVIRSWDLLLKKEISVMDTRNNVLVIIDSLCNLDLLYYAAAHSGDTQLASIATTHARKLIETHLLPETATTLASDGYGGQLYSTCHVANVDPTTGELKWRWTAQGYANDSTWSRGQAWAVLGYAQTYNWTKDQVFLEVACGVAEYFLYRLETAPACVDVSIVDETGATRTVGRHVPLWDFDAPSNNPADPPPRDSSAGMIASNGLLLLSQALSARGDHTLSKRFLEAAIRIIRDTLDLSLAEETARLSWSSGAEGTLQVEDTVPGKTFDSVLKHGTANNNEFARRRLADHGLVYGDYYLIESGNRLIQMGLV